MRLLGDSRLAYIAILYSGRCLDGNPSSAKSLTCDIQTLCLFESPTLILVAANVTPWRVSRSEVYHLDPFIL